MFQFFKIVLFTCFSLTLSIQVFATGPSVSFNQPYNNQRFYYGHDIYVNVHAADHDGIEYVDLYLNDTQHLIDRETKYPYEWNSRYNHKLKNLQPGKYKLIAIAKDKRGYKTIKYIYIYIDYKPDHCEPTYNPEIGFYLPHVNTYYEYGEKIYVKATAHTPMQYIDLYLNDCHHFISRESKSPYEWSSDFDHKLKNLAPGVYKLILIGVDYHGRKHIIHRKFYVKDRYPVCDYGYEFKCIKDGDRFYTGSDIYVEMDVPYGKESVDYMVLYVNGQQYGREDHWPYQWGKGFKYSGNTVLNNVHAGAYRLRCEVYDKCGNKKYREATIYVDDCPSANFHNYEHYDAGYSITNEHKWAKLSGYQSAVVGGHGLSRKQSLKVAKGYGAALDLGYWTTGRFEVCHYLYVPHGYQSLIGFYDNHSNYVAGFTEKELGYDDEYWKCVKYKFDLYKKEVQLYVNGKYINTYSFDNHHVRYMVLNGVYDYHKYYVDDVYIVEDCVH